MDKIKLSVPLNGTQTQSLKAGDNVLISGVIYTARDAAHKKLVALLQTGQPLPCDLADQIIYYVGPSPAKPGTIIGSAGPTTSYRMDAYTPVLMDEAGLRGMIGKGLRSEAVKDAICRNKGVYFAAIGGAAALLASAITACEVIAYPELESEAIHRLEVVDFPAVVVIDCHGGDLYKTGRAEYLASASEAK